MGAPERGEHVRRASTARRTTGGSRRRARTRASFVASTESGLHSTVTSASAARVDRVEDPRELRRRRAATACRRRRTRSSPGGERRGARGRRTHASTYVVDQVRAVGPGREVAVVAARRAERDVHVHAGARDSVRRRSSVVQAERGDERLLGDLDAADLLHPLLAFLLALEQLALPRDVTAVALGDARPCASPSPSRGR